MPNVEGGNPEPSCFATGLTHDFDDDARAELRQSGVNLAIEVDGRVWCSPGVFVFAITQTSDLELNLTLRTHGAAVVFVG